MTPDHPLRFVVITKNSARWFGVILAQYRALGIAPFVMLDRSSDDGTEELLIGRKIEYVKVASEYPRLEAFIKLIPEHVPSEWIIRIDDDELPSRFLCMWLKARLRVITNNVVGFQRRWIRLTPSGNCEYSRHPLIVSSVGGLDIQWRLFRAAAVRYNSAVHTPGFLVPPNSPVAPNPAYIAHFSWLVRTASERRLQVDDYDNQTQNAGSRFRDIKVWEDCDAATHNFQSNETDEFNATAAELLATV